MALIQTKDVCNDFWSDKEKFDFSDYPKDSKFHDVTNTKIIGGMNDETPCEIIKEFISLRSKMYSYIKDNNQNNKTAKGLNEL